MTIPVSCLPPPSFTAQKLRKLLFQVRLFLGPVSGAPQGPCRLRVTLVSLGSTTLPGIFGLQQVPNFWGPPSAQPPLPPGAITAVETTFDPNAPLPTPTVLPSFFDTNSPQSPFNGYNAGYVVEVFDANNGLQGTVTFPLSGNSNAVAPVSVVLALDHGSSMSTTDPSTGLTRLARLNQALPLGLALLNDGDTVGAATFGNLNCSPNPTSPMGPATALHQNDITSLAAALTPDKSRPAVKPIQKGIIAARNLPGAGTASTTLVLLTDGMNTDAGGFNLTTPTMPTSALIIGENPVDMPSSVLTMIPSGSHYAFASAMTMGEFAIEKLLTQVLIGLAGATYISDPEGTLAPGGALPFPLHITEADHELSVIVFSNDAQEIDLDFGELGLGNTHDLRRCNDKSAHLEVVRGKGFLVARGLLPVLEGERAIQPKVVLSRLKHPRNQRAAPIRYSLHAIAKSDLMLDARASATGLTVGSELLFSAVLTEYGLHLDRPAGSVIVELTHPDGGKQTIALEQVKDSPGRFHGSHRTYRTGVYTAHFIVTGASYLHKRPFRRECVRTVAVFAPKECCLSEAPNLADITAT